MFPESHPFIRRILRFIALPYCYLFLVNWKECTSSKIQVLKDLLYIFFQLKYFPYNYSPCRLWEKDRKTWSFYYGSSYEPYQRQKLRREVQRYEYLSIFDDKEVCELLCRGIGVYLPRYFGTISPDIDYRGEISKVFSNFNIHKIIIKPTNGQGGKGIAIAVFENGKINVWLKENIVELSKFKLEEKSILQEVIIQNDVISNISSSSVNTIRVLTLLTNSNEAIVLSTSMRFGVGNSYIDNWSAGGVAVGVEKKCGHLHKIAFDKKGKRYLKHPVSKIQFDGFQVPCWKEIVNLAKDIQKACPFFKLLGMDIALTQDNKPVLIEINPNSDIVFQEQTAGPLLTDTRTYNEFKNYNLFVNKYQKKLYLS